MGNLFLSIITINYNNAPGLRKTLESVKNQTSSNYEHIIIDGASSDESLSVIKEFLEDQNYAKQVTFWCSEKDKGIYDAMNKGIPHANGKYCLFLNSGDYLADNDVVEKTSNMNLVEDIVTFNYYAFGKKFKKKCFQAKEMNALFWLKCDGLNHQSTLIKTELQKNHPYGSKYKVRNDSDFFMKVFFQDNASYRHEEIFFSLYEAETGFSSVTNKEIMKNERAMLLHEYIPDFIQKDLENLLIYEYNYHGMLRKIKALFKTYSSLKKFFLRKNKS